MPDFSFGHYEFIDDGIIEITAHEGAELDLLEAEECLCLYREHQSIGVLVNRMHKYTSSLEFNMTVAEAPEVFAFAILVESERAAMVAESQKLFFKNPFKIFFNRDSAMAWLREQRNTAH